MKLEDFNFERMEKSLKRIRKIRSEIIEKTINMEGRLDGVIVRYFNIKDDMAFRIQFLYGSCPTSLRQKIEVLKVIKNGKYKKLGNEIDKLRLIRNYFAHSPSGAFEDPTIISRYVKPVKADEELEKFRRIYDKCLFELTEIIKEQKSV